MLIKETHVVPDGISGIRFSDYAREVFTSIPSRKGISKAIKNGELIIDGEKRETGTWVKSGQIIEHVDPQQTKPKSYEIPLKVVYEDEHFAAIDKPAGIEVNGNKFKTIENAVQFNIKPSCEPDALKWPRPVHRIDIPTTGLLLIAKTSRAQVNLGHQFELREIKKRYRAIVIGKPQLKGYIDSTVKGFKAYSEYKLVRSVNSLKSGHVSLVDLYPLSGRTHQLRIHMSDSGFPILGDKQYGTEGLVLKGKGLFLSAVELNLKHPVTGEDISIKIDEPEKFGTYLEREQRRWEKYNK